MGWTWVGLESMRQEVMGHDEKGCGWGRMSWDQRQPVGPAASEEGVGNVGLPLSCRGCWARLEDRIFLQWHIPAALGTEGLRPTILRAGRGLTCHTLGMRQGPICHFRSQRGWCRDAAGWEGKGQEGEGLDGVGRGWDFMRWDWLARDGIGLHGMGLDETGRDGIG